MLDPEKLAAKDGMNQGEEVDRLGDNGGTAAEEQPRITRNATAVAMFLLEDIKVPVEQPKETVVLSATAVAMFLLEGVKSPRPQEKAA